MTENGHSETISKSEAGELLRISPRSIDRMIEAGQLTKLSKRGHVLKAEVLSYVDKRGEVSDPVAALATSIKALQGMVESLGKQNAEQGRLMLESQKTAMRVMEDMVKRLAKQNEQKDAAQLELMGLAGDVLLRSQERQQAEEQHRHRLQLMQQAVSQVVSMVAAHGVDTKAREAFDRFSEEERAIVLEMLRAKGDPKVDAFADMLTKTSQAKPEGGDSAESDE